MRSAIETIAARWARAMMLAVGLALVGLVPSCLAQQAGGETVAFGADDSDMNTAIRAARANLDAFEAAVLAEEGSMAMFKVAIPHPGGAEHIWLTITELTKTSVTGKLANDGVDVALKAGAEYTAQFDQVSDWMVMHPPFDSGRIFGAYTTRVILAREPGSVPAGVAKRLQPLP